MFFCFFFILEIGHQLFKFSLPLLRCAAIFVHWTAERVLGIRSDSLLKREILEMDCFIHVRHFTLNENRPMNLDNKSKVSLAHKTTHEFCIRQTFLNEFSELTAKKSSAREPSPNKKQNLSATEIRHYTLPNTPVFIHRARIDALWRRGIISTS